MSPGLWTSVVLPAVLHALRGALNTLEAGVVDGHTGEECRGRTEVAVAKIREASEAIEDQIED